MIVIRTKLCKIIGTLEKLDINGLSISKIALRKAILIYFNYSHKCFHYLYISLVDVLALY